ncbi:unnamed protein product [Calypogeia fissa]
MEQEKKAGLKPKVEQVVKVKVLMFARARELAGTSEMELLMPEGSTTAECVTVLTGKFPPLESIRDCIVLALNFNYLTDPVKVKDGDELAIIPPISGG